MLPSTIPMCQTTQTPPSYLKVVAWSDANNTLVDPPLDQLLSAGEVLYVIGDPDEVEFFKNYVVSENILD